MRCARKAVTAKNVVAGSERASLKMFARRAATQRGAHCRCLPRPIAAAAPPLYVNVRHAAARTYIRACRHAINRTRRHGPPPRSVRVPPCWARHAKNQRFEMPTVMRVLLPMSGYSNGGGGYRALRRSNQRLRACHSAIREYAA